MGRNSQSLRILLRRTDSLAWNPTLRRGSVVCRNDLRLCGTESRVSVRGSCKSWRNAYSDLSALRLPAERRRPHAPALEKPARWRFKLLLCPLNASDGAEMFELRQCLDSRDPSLSGDGSRRNGHYFQIGSLSSANIDDRLEFLSRSTGPIVGLNWSLARGWRLLSWVSAIKGIVAGSQNYLVGRRQSQRAAVGMNSGR